jgi:hypothetical protein
MTSFDKHDQIISSLRFRRHTSFCTPPTSFSGAPMQYGRVLQVIGIGSGCGEEPSPPITNNTQSSQVGLTWEVCSLHAASRRHNGDTAVCKKTCVHDKVARHVQQKTNASLQTTRRLRSSSKRCIFGCHAEETKHLSCTTVYSSTAPAYIQRHIHMSDQFVTQIMPNESPSLTAHPYQDNY